MSKRKLISIVTPCYREEQNVPLAHQAVKKLFQGPLKGYDYEHIFADNCSPDGTVGVLKAIAAKDKHVKIIANARNFGAFRSMFNALMRSSGDGVVVMLAADLQDPPELIPQFVKKWEEGFQVVYGIRQNRKESWLMRAARSLFYRLVEFSANVRIPRNAGEFQLIDRKVVEALRQCKDYYPYVRGMIANAGFKATGIGYDWGLRRHGKSTANFFHLYDNAINGLISFTNLPMRFSVFAGLFLSAGSLLVALVSALIALFSPQPVAPHGIITLVVLVLFFSGIQLLFIGIIGEYIAAIHSQVRQGFYVTEQELVNFAPRRR